MTLEELTEAVGLDARRRRLSETVARLTRNGLGASHECVVAEKEWRSVVSRLKSLGIKWDHPVIADDRPKGAA